MMYNRMKLNLRENMILSNRTNNTLYADDIDMHIPYENGKQFEISPDTLKKSKSIRALIVGLLLHVEKYDPDEQVESAVIFLRNKKIKELKAQSSSVPEKPEPEKISIPTKTSPTVSDHIEVKMHGLFYDDSGYAKVNRNLALKLHNAGIQIKISPKSSRNQLSESDLKNLVKLEKTQISREHIQIDSVVPSFSEISSAKYKILYTTVESYTVPKQFVDCCELYDEIWITSPWSADILKQYVKKPIYVVPAGVDETLYKEEGESFVLPNTKKFVFLSVFAWGYRKGYDVLLRAFFDEFSESDDVSLLIVSKYQGNASRYHKNKIKEDIEQIMREFPNKDLPHVVRYGQLTAEQDMPKLYRAADCFISTTRGEGSALPPVEASMCGLPLIMTNASGQQMYLREDTAFLIEPDELVEIQRGQMHIHFWDGQKFPALTSKKVHEQTKKLMRYVYSHYDEAKKKNRKMKELILNNFTWNHTCDAAVNRLQEITRLRNKK